MNKYHQFIHKYHIWPIKYTLLKNVKIVTTEQEKYVIKQKKRRDKFQVYQYLLSRSFDYFPYPINDIEQEQFEIFPFLEDVKTPLEQKAIDLIYLISLLHNKTTFYKEVDLDDIKSFYEKTENQLVYLEQYYLELQMMIEENVYMSPSEYLLIRNMSKLYSVIYFCKEQLKSWYQLITQKKKERFVLVHNHLEIDHFMKGDKPYLISWDHAKLDLPIYDLYHFYKKHYLDLDFISLFEIYESKYPLLEEEKILLWLLLSIPEKIELSKDEFGKCQEISKYLLYLEKTNMLISKQNSKKTNQKTT